MRDEIGGRFATVKQLEAQLARAEFDLQETTVRAPTAGYVSNLQLSPGAFLGSGTPAVSFVCSDDPWVVAVVTENGLEHVQPGNEVEVAIALYPGRVFSGKVQSIVWGVGQAQAAPTGALPDVEGVPGPQKYMVRLEIEDDRGQQLLRQGTTATAAIYTERGRMLHVIRKVQVRIQSMLDYLYL